MTSKVKLLALGIAVLIILLSGETYAWQVLDKNSGQNNPIRVACVGDSITCGTLYPDDLWLMLGPKYLISNFGVNGATIYIHSGNPYVYTPAFKAAKQFEPQIVIIMLGTNDANPALNESNADFISEYTLLVTQFQELASKPKVWVAEPPPIFPNNSGLNGTYLAQNIIPDVQQVAKQTGADLIDVYTAMLGHSTYFSDGVHPDSDGSAVVANVTYTAITSAVRPSA